MDEIDAGPGPRRSQALTSCCGSSRRPAGAGRLEDHGVQARERWGHRLGEGRKARAREALGAGRLHSGQVQEG